jgi:hypothetical protein
LITNEVKPLSNTRENTIKPFGFLFPWARWCESMRTRCPFTSREDCFSQNCVNRRTGWGCRCAWRGGARGKEWTGDWCITHAGIECAARGGYAAQLEEEGEYRGAVAKDSLLFFSVNEK